METLKIFLAGRWREGRGELMQSRFPADGSLNAELHAANLDDVNDAVAAAERAWRAPEWRQQLPAPAGGDPAARQRADRRAVGAVGAVANPRQRQTAGRNPWTGGQRGRHRALFCRRLRSAGG
ncbi:Uncharacterised protein [Serratia odorifera]|uniref:Betaine-aldehyde dehydrogenase n=1 Tax=Serratia odorifera TaxID=618 RepID=A0A447KS44_SEROD|nr:Uncharacterised protein [Serratia odorifera]